MLDWKKVKVGDRLVSSDQDRISVIVKKLTKTTIKWYHELNADYSEYELKNEYSWKTYSIDISYRNKQNANKLLGIK